MDEAPRLLISDLLTYLESYLTPEQVREVYRAYLFGAEAHQGQIRQSGEPTSTTPLRWRASWRTCAWTTSA